jgi:hypothetical protein
VLVAFSLRPAVAALSPILAEVQADFAVPTWVVGLIGTAPPVCFAVFGIVTPTLERRFGLERLAAASMLVVTAAHRAFPRGRRGHAAAGDDGAVRRRGRGQRRAAAADQDVLPRSRGR